MGSRMGSRYRLTTSCATLSPTVGMPSGRVRPSPLGRSTRRWNQPKMFGRLTSTLSARESHFRTVKAETWCDMWGFGECDSEVSLRLVGIEPKDRPYTEAQ